MARNILSATLPVTKLLQASDLEIFDGIHLIESLKTLCSKFRNDVDEFHLNWYNEAMELARSVDVPESKPRIVGRQKNRANTPSDSTSDYFKRVCTIPIIDFLSSEMKRRFDYANILIYKGSAIIPKKLLSLLSSNNNSWRSGLLELCEFYCSDKWKKVNKKWKKKKKTTTQTKNVYNHIVKGGTCEVHHHYHYHGDGNGD